MATIQAASYVGLSSFALSPGVSRPKSAHCSANLARGGLLPYTRAVMKTTSSKLASPSTASLGFASSSITETRLRGAQVEMLRQGKSQGGGALGATCSLPLAPETLRWIFVAAASVLLFLKSTGVPKAFLVPLLVFEAPREALGWLKGDFGLWAAFFALAVKLFYALPVELDLPLYALLFIITAPRQLTQYRGTTACAVASLAVAGYAAYHHYKSSGNIKGLFEGEKIFPSIAMIAVLVVPILFLVNGVQTAA